MKVGGVIRRMYFPAMYVSLTVYVTEKFGNKDLEVFWLSFDIIFV